MSSPNSNTAHGPHAPAPHAHGAPAHGHGKGLPGDPQSEAVSALQQLGYKPAEAVRMARDACVEGDDAATIIRKALKSALR